MDSGVQFKAVDSAGRLFYVVVDGMFAGRLEDLGDSVVWRAWFMTGSLKLRRAEFERMLRKAS